jgi:chemotaxis protein CheD
MKRSLNSMETKCFNPAALSPEYMKGFEHAADAIAAKHFLLPGQYLVSKDPTVVSTILGSCVSICLWDQRLGIGGINHFLLPEGDTNTNGMRYGNVANQVLLDKLLDLGCSTKSLQAKVFGGAHTFSTGNLEQSLGARNVQVALEFLRKHGIRVVEKEVSGKAGRRVVFTTNIGTTTVKLLTCDAAQEGTSQR